MKLRIRVLLAVAAVVSALTFAAACSGAQTPSETSPTDSVSQDELRPQRTRGELEDIVESEIAGKFDCTYDGNHCAFTLCLPEMVDENTPLVIMLHGYPGSGEGMRTDTGFDEKACPRGYAVAYATAPTGGWNSLMKTSDIDDIGYLEALAAYLQNEYGLSKELTFAAGFSNGGFMTQYLAVDSEETFRAVACVAGMMPKKVWEMRSAAADMGVLHICGTKDDVVPQNRNETAKYSINPAIEDVMAYWTEANGLDKEETTALSDIAELTKYTGGSCENQVWTVVIDGGHHSWPDEAISGFDTNELILDFFDTYRK